MLNGMKLASLALLLGFAVSQPLAAQGADEAPAGKEKRCEGKEGKRHKGKRGKKHRKRDHIKRMDTDQNGSISREEAKGPIAEKFDEIDANSDGELTKEELKAFGDARRAEKKADKEAEE